MGSKARADGSHSPRDPSAAHLLTTVLGDYWFDSAEHIPSASLVAVLGEFGIGADAARAALSRLCRQGRLERAKEGRRTSYRLAPSLRSAAATRGRLLARYGLWPVPWGGQWLCVAFSVPEADRTRRSALRQRLRRLRMAPLVDGVWISPHDLVDEVRAALDAAGVTGATLLRAAEIEGPDGARLIDAWDLPAWRKRLERFGDTVDALDERVARGSVGAAEALVARTDLMARWRSLAVNDPGLPDELLPPGWPLRDVRDRFVAVYDTVGPLAEQRIRELTGVAADDPAGPRHHRLGDVAG